MAGSTYPAEILTADGSKITENGEIQFLSATNQPATAPNALYVKQFPFTYQTAGLATGYTLYTPAVGDLIYDIGLSVTTGFNGTTPLADVGTFSGGNVGILGELVGAGKTLATADDAVTDNAGLSTTHANQWLNDAVGSVGAAAGAAYKPPILVVTTANPLLLVVSQSGQKSGTAIGGTAGVGVVYIVTGSPA